MRLRHIEVFNAIMLTGSVSAAARLINITQPAVSRTLEQREAELDFGVLQRAADRRLRDVDEPGRRAHAAGEHDGVEDLDVAQAHRVEQSR